MVFFDKLHPFPRIYKLEVFGHEPDIVLDQAVQFLFGGQLAVGQAVQFFLVCGEPAVLMKGCAVGKEKQKADKIESRKKFTAVCC